MLPKTSGTPKRDRRVRDGLEIILLRMESKLDKVVGDVSELKDDHLVLREIIFGDGDKNIGLSGKVLVLQKSVTELEDKIKIRDRALVAVSLIFVSATIGVIVLILTGQIQVGP